MEHRIVHRDNKVIECVEHTDLNVTGSTAKFVIDELPDAIEQLTGKGIDISLLWKQGFINRIEPQNEEIAISDHPTAAGIKRKVFVHSMPINQNDKSFHINLIVRHFDAEGNHIPDQHEDVWFSDFVDNSTLVEGVGEYDYFKGLVDNDISIFYLQTAHIPQFDANGRFGESLYD